MNFLHSETSPYLRQHETDPVNWMPWGELAFARARAEKKPVLLSIGYAACHWCHVMHHESFTDDLTARLINSHFIAVKVDREEHPDIDQQYQQALGLMGKQGGWPLTMFLSPDGRPIWGGTYFPPEARHGLPGFREVLAGIARGWAEEQRAIQHNTQAVADGIADLQAPSPGAGQLTAGLVETALALLLARMDTVNGGFGTAPKFPLLPALGFLWDAGIYADSLPARDAVLTAVTALCQGGIYDHIGGGLARYSVDAEWLVPHFEKMLGDNALFLQLLAEAGRETRHPLFAARAAETVSFLRREMMASADGLSAFVSARDADSDGKEGAFALWTSDEVAAVLGPADAAVFCAAYDITRAGNWTEAPAGSGYSIPNRLHRRDWRGDTAEEDLRHMADRLLDARLLRPQPARDDKVIAELNGHMITALTMTARAFDRPDDLALARHVFDFICTHLTDPASGRLLRSWCDGRGGGPALLDDYAAMGIAAIALYTATADDRYLSQAESWAAVLLGADFMADDKIRFKMSAAPPLVSLAAVIPVDDGPLPSGNALAAQFLAQLSLLSTDIPLSRRAGERARSAIAAMSGEFQRLPLTRSGALRALLWLDHGQKVTVPPTDLPALAELSVPQALIIPRAGVPEICQGLKCTRVTGALLPALRAARRHAAWQQAND